MSAAKQEKPEKVRSLRAAAYRVRRRIATGVAVVLTIFFAYHVVFGRNGVNNYEQKRAQDKALQQKIESLKQDNAGLRDHVGRLKDDPDAIEYEAREKLHYVRPGEVIYKLNQQPSANGGQAASPGAARGPN